MESKKKDVYKRQVISMPHSKFELEQAIERAYSKRFTMPNLSSPLRKRNS